MDCWLSTRLDVKKCGAHYSKISFTTESKKIQFAFSQQCWTDTAPFVCSVPANFKCQWWVSADLQLFFFFPHAPRCCSSCCSQRCSTHTINKDILKKKKKKEKSIHHQKKTRKSGINYYVLITKQTKKKLGIPANPTRTHQSVAFTETMKRSLLTCWQEHGPERVYKS